MNPLQARHNERVIDVTYQEQTGEAETTPGSGSYAPTWGNDFPLKMVEEELTGRELIRAGQIDAETPVLLRAHYADSKTFTAAGRFVDSDGRVYDVKGIREMGRQGREFRCVRHEEDE